MSSADVTSDETLSGSRRSPLDETAVARPAGGEGRERRRPGRVRPGRVRPGRVRPGRVRRWLLRPFFWGLTLVVALVFVLQLLLDTGYARRWAGEVLTERLGAALDRRVELDDISFSIFPLAVELWGFTIAGPDDLDSDLPFLEIPWVAIDVDLQALQRNVVRLREVRVERPRIYLQFFPEGVSNLVKLNRENRRRPRARRFDVRIDHVEVERAEFLLDQESVKLSLSGDAIRARFQGVGHLHVEGELSGQNMVVRLPGARSITTSVYGKGSIQRGRVEIESAEASGPGVTATGSGVCEWPPDDVKDKKCEIRVRGRTSGEKLAEVGYFQHLRGDLDVAGLVTWRPRHFGWRSRVTAPRVTIWDREVQDVEGDLEADRYQARLIVRRARYGGGTLDGAINMSTRKAGRPTLVDLDFQDVMADRLLADQNIPSGPIAARVAGNVVYKFPLQDGRRGSGQGEVTLTADPDHEGLPLEGGFPLRIDGGVIRADSVVLSSDERQSILVGGSYDLDRLRGRFDYKIESADVLPLIRTTRLVEEGEPWPQWLPTAGEGRLEGTLHLAPGRASTELGFRLSKVLGPDIDAPHKLSGRFHLDRSGLEQMTIELADATPADSALAFHGRIPFAAGDGRYAAGDPGIQLAFTAYSWPLDSIRPWLDFDLAMGGKISGRLDLHVGDAGSDGHLQGVVSPATLLDVELDAAAGRLDWNPQRLRFSEVTLRAPAGEVEGGGTLTWLDETGAARDSLDVDLETTSLVLGRAPIRGYLPRSDLNGEVALTAHLSGSWDHPRLELKVKADGLAVGPRVLEARPSELDVRWAGGRVEASGRLLDMVTLQGGGTLDRERGDLVFDLDGNDVGGLLELLYEEPPDNVGGSFAGRLRVAGEISGDKLIDVALDRMDVNYRGRRLANLEPVLLSLEPEHLEIGALSLEERATGSEFVVTGRMGYGAGAPIELELRSKLSNSWLRLYRSDVAADGYLEVAGRVRGTMAEPYLDGQGTVRAGSVVLEGLPDFPHTFEDVRGLLHFNRDGIVVDHLEAALAGGHVRVTGRADVPRAGEPLSYRLQVTGSDLRLRYPEGFLIEGSTELTLRTLDPPGGDPLERSYLLAGKTDLRGLEYTENIPLGFTQVLQDTLLRQRLEVNPADEILSAIQLNVEVEGPGALRVRNNLAELDGSVDLRLRGNMAQPIFLGALELDPGGKLIYSSVDYELDRGSLTFADPSAFDPEVDLVATTRVRDFDVILTLTGTMERLNAGFTSEPPLPALEVFELLATGGDEALESNPVRRADEIGQEQSMSAASFLYGQAAEVIGERVSSLFGFDKFRIAPLTGSGDNLSTARVTVGKRLSKDVFLSYSADPASTEEQRLQIEWQVGGGLVVVLTQNGDNTYEADARWETSF